MPATVRLTVVEGPGQGAVHRFEEPTVAIAGRSRDCNVRLPDDEAHGAVSRMHCFMDVNPPSLRVRDFGSRNGTFVNGRMIGKREVTHSIEEGRRLSFPEVDLKDGDRISIGTTVFLVGIDVPLACVACGREAGPGDAPTARAQAAPARAQDAQAEERRRATWRCAACRAKAATDSLVIDGALTERRACARCKAPADGGAEDALRRGEVLCKACRADTGSLLKEVMLAASSTFDPFEVKAAQARAKPATQPLAPGSVAAPAPPPAPPPAPAPAAAAAPAPAPARARAAAPAVTPIDPFTPLEEALLGPRRATPEAKAPPPAPPPPPPPPPPPQPPPPAPPAASPLAPPPHTQRRTLPGARSGTPAGYLGTFAGYQLLRRIGAEETGGLGDGYVARLGEGTDEVLVRVLLPRVAVSEQARESFLIDLAQLRLLDHAAVVRSLGHGHVVGAFFVVYERAPGVTAQALVRERGPIAPSDAADIANRMLMGLAYIHERLRVPHRDICPRTLFVARSDQAGAAAAAEAQGELPFGVERVVKLAETGLSRAYRRAGLADPGLTGDCIGTPAFMPRQQLLNFQTPEPAHDVWSAAAVLYFLLTGETPRVYARDADLLKVTLTEAPVPILKRRPDVPPALAEVVDRALDDRKDLRYDTAKELAKAVREAAP